MLLERFEEEGLSHYSYAVGCARAEKIAIVDPRRDVDVYLDFAAGQDLEISHVLETHIHADYASGARELAQRTGAKLCVSAYDRDEIFEVRFPHEDLHDGDSVVLGSVRIEALHTPGHTPEHVAFLVYDEARSATVPSLILSGDFLFVGSLGRPDLLGEEAKRALAGQLYESSRKKLKDLPDGLEIHPAHGAGSLCGSGMSGRALSTLGYERLTNPYLRPGLSREEFVEEILSSVPPFPDYYRRMKRLNSDGPPILDGLPGLQALDAERIAEGLSQGCVLIDTRDQLGFGAGHIEGSFGIGADRRLPFWAAWTVPYDTPILLVAIDRAAAEKAVRGLIRVGLDRVEGYLKGGIEAWIRSGRALRQTPQLTPRQIEEERSRNVELQILDVRTPEEWRSGHIPGALHLPLQNVLSNLDRLPEVNGPVAIVCGSGYRSTVAASLLERASRDTWNVTGGMKAWIKAGLPLSQSASATEHAQVGPTQPPR